MKEPVRAGVERKKEDSLISGSEHMSERILVVDDELFVRELLMEFLSSQGYEVSLADTGESAVKAVESQPVDVVLLDLKMPGIDGIETLKQIKEIDPTALAIIMTGYPTIESSIEALRSGAYDYVVKPFKLNELKSCVEKALEEHKLKSEIGQLKDRIAQLEAELEKFSDAQKRT
jgi:DNA-binding NtrC family response regulator